MSTADGATLTAIAAVIVRGPGSHLTADGYYKLMYSNRKRAKKAARRVKRFMGKVQRPYQCSECFGWHLASGPRRMT